MLPWPLNALLTRVLPTDDQNLNFLLILMSSQEWPSRPEHTMQQENVSSNQESAKEQGGHWVTRRMFNTCLMPHTYKVIPVRHLLGNEWVGANRSAQRDTLLHVQYGKFPSTMPDALPRWCAKLGALLRRTWCIVAPNTGHKKLCLIFWVHLRKIFCWPNFPIFYIFASLAIFFTFLS